MLIEEKIAAELGWLGRLARRYYDDEADAQDLLGDTVCRMLEYRDRYASSLPFRPWAKTVMENIYITSYNRRRKVLFRSLDCEYPFVGDSRADACAEIGSLLSAIAAMAAHSVCVEAVMLYAVGGYSYDEAARVMGVSVDAVRTRIATGRKIIKRSLGVD